MVENVGFLIFIEKVEIQNPFWLVHTKTSSIIVVYLSIMMSQWSIPLPVFALLAASQVSQLGFRQRQWPWWTKVCLEAALAYSFQICLSLSDHQPNDADDVTTTTLLTRSTFATMIPWWGPMTHILSMWPRLLQKNRKDRLSSYLSYLLHGGPLGRGCRKVVEILAAFILWKALHGDWPVIPWGPFPHWTTIIIVILLSLVVNGVLTMWSHATQSRGDHVGVQDMVHSTQGRALMAKEHAVIAALAFLNALCEEITARHFWYKAFEVYSCLSASTNTTWNTLSTSTISSWLSTQQSANMAQALVFGLWHYQGIPSGVMGVALTFIYGFIMGLLLQFGQGLLLPVLAHTMADYFIFSVIVRQQQGNIHQQSKGVSHNDKTA